MSQEIIKQQIEAPQTLEKFGKIFGAIHKVDNESAQQMFELQKFHFMRSLQEKNLTDVTPISAMGVFLEVVGKKLSFASDHVYLMSRNVNVGSKDSPKWEKRLVYSKTFEGKIFLSIQSGAVSRVSDPEIVYAGEEFEAGNIDGVKYLRHKRKFPRPSNQIIAGYVFKVFPDGTKEPFWLDTQDIERLKAASAKQNKGTANALYSSGPGGQIDIGFFATKVVNMALKYVDKSNDQRGQNEIAGEIAEAVTATGVTALPEVEEGSQFEPAMIAEPAQTAQPTVKAEVISESTKKKGDMPF